MSEVVFPVLGAALVIALVLPATALVARLMLAALDRATPIGGAPWLALRYGILVAASALPIAWFASAAAHQAESGRSVLACILEHGDDAACVEPRLFSLTLLGAMLLLATPTLVRAVRDGAVIRVARRRGSHARVSTLIDDTAALSALRGRVYVLDGLPDAIASRGLVRSVVLVRAEWLASLDDAAVVAALAHEAEHVRDHDPLRYLLLSLSAVINPLGSLILRRDVRRWIAAREMQCDRLAVRRGADPAALAHALVVAARPRMRTIAAATLVSPELRALEHRVEMLLAYGEHPPRPVAETSAPVLRLAFVLLVVVIALPHGGETTALDALHVGTERAVASLFP